MAVNTAVAIFLSLRQGPFVAALGLIGGFLTPVLIQTGQTSVGLFVYLFLIELGLIAVTRIRNWPILTGVTLIAGFGWVAAWLLFLFRPADAPWLALFVISTVALFVFTIEIRRDTWGSEKSPNILSMLTMLAGLLVAGMQLNVSGFNNLDWSYFGLLVAGTIVLGRLRPKLEVLAWLAVSACGVALVLWQFGSGVSGLRYYWTVLALGTLCAGGTYAALWGSVQPNRWTLTSAAASMGFFLITCLPVLKLPYNRGGIALTLAGLWTIASIAIARFRSRNHSYEESLNIGSTVVAVFAAVAAWFHFEEGGIAVAWAGELMAMAVIAAVFNIHSLRTSARILGVLILLRLLNPAALSYPLSNHLLANWLWWGYGLPVLAFVIASRFFRRTGDEGLVTALEYGAMLIGLAFITLLVRQYFHPGHIDTWNVALNEWATFAIGWLSLACGLLIVHRTWPRPSLWQGGRIIAGLALIGSVFITGLVQNPLFVHHPVGERVILNSLLWIYGVPALLALFIARELVRRNDIYNARWMGALCLLLVFILVSLEVRQGFQGTYLDAHGTSQAENYTYSLAWIVLGVVLLVLGIMIGGTVLRYASLAVILVAVGKVFLFDTAHLRDLYRVVSFLGLGLTLLVLAYVYQRFVFRRSDLPQKR